MASVRAGRDVGMNDLPLPGQPGFGPQMDIDPNTMRPVIAGPLAGSPVVNGADATGPDGPPVPSSLVTPYDYRPDNVAPPTVDDKINRIVTPDPATFPTQQPKVPPTPAPPPPLPMLKPQRTVTAQFTDNSTPGLRQQQADVIRKQINDGTLNPDVGNKQLQIIKGLPGGENTDISVNPGSTAQGFDWKKLAAGAGGVGLIGLLANALLRHRAPPSELEKVLSLGSDVTPALEDLRPRTEYPDDTVANATDEARMRVNDASGGQPVTQETTDAAARQNAINNGDIKPDQYNEGEKPQPGTPGYKLWFKSRQDAAKARKQTNG